MATSHEWRLYFESNAKSLLVIPWERGAELTPDETAAIAKSLQEFQAGESSEGKHLFHHAQKYAERRATASTSRSFDSLSRKSSCHARDLGRFLCLNNIPLVPTTFTDQVFRKLRNLFGGLEVLIAVLITAEIIAKVYYAVLREASQSVILRRLCDQILSDELRHVQFQAEQLAKLRLGRKWLGRTLTMGLQRFLFLGTTLVVWLFHRRTIRRGGLPLWGWCKLCWREFAEAFPKDALHITLVGVAIPLAAESVEAPSTPVKRFVSEGDRKVF